MICCIRSCDGDKLNLVYEEVGAQEIEGGGGFLAENLIVEVGN
jgi:hypothetical protein